MKSARTPPSLESPQWDVAGFYGGHQHLARDLDPGDNNFRKETAQIPDEFCDSQAHQSRGTGYQKIGLVNA